MENSDRFINVKLNFNIKYHSILIFNNNQLKSLENVEKICTINSTVFGLTKPSLCAEVDTIILGSKLTSGQWTPDLVKPRTTCNIIV